MRSRARRAGGAAFAALRNRRSVGRPVRSTGTPPPRPQWPRSLSGAVLITPSSPTPMTPSSSSSVKLNSIWAKVGGFLLPRVSSPASKGCWKPKNTVKSALECDVPPKYQRSLRGSVVDEVEPRIRELLQAYPWLTAHGSPPAIRSPTLRYCSCGGIRTYSPHEVPDELVGYLRRLVSPSLAWPSAR